MVALVACETLLLALLLLLVVGLLRSHAEILRRLGPPDEESSAGTPSTGATTSPREETGAPGPSLPAPGRRAGLREGHDVAGVTLERDAVKIGLAENSPPTLLAFLSSGCAVCERFWKDLDRRARPDRDRRARPDLDRRARPTELPDDVRIVAVTKDPSHESPSRLRALAPAAPLVMSSAAWRDYGVPASPYFVYLERGRVHGEGSASHWGQIASLLRDAVEDHAQHGGERRAGDIDRALAAAGIGPGHPSLYPAGRPERAGSGTMPNQEGEA